MKTYRAGLLRFDADAPARASAIYDEDGLLVVAPNAAGVQTVLAAGSFQALHAKFQGVEIEHLPGRIIAPDFVDMHLHYPQTDLIGSPAPGLLPWLENFTFPEEKRFKAVKYITKFAIYIIA